MDLNPPPTPWQINNVKELVEFKLDLQSREVKIIFSGKNWKILLPYLIVIWGNKAYCMQLKHDRNIRITLCLPEEVEDEQDSKR